MKEKGRRAQKTRAAKK